MAKPVITYSLLDSFGNYVVMIDGYRTGFAVSEDKARTIVAWLESAAEEIEIKRIEQ